MQKGRGSESVHPQLLHSPGFCSFRLLSASHQSAFFTLRRPEKNLGLVSVLLGDGGHGGGVEAAAGSEAPAGRTGRGQRSGPCRVGGGEEEERRGGGRGRGGEDQVARCWIPPPPYQSLAAQRCRSQQKVQSHVISWDGLVWKLAESLHR